MTTLNEIADYVAGKLNDPFNNLLKDEIKFAVSNYRALLIRRDAERNIAAAHFFQVAHIPLIKVDAIEDCTYKVDCNILRSENRVPMSVRRKSPVPFDTVSALEIKGIKDIFSYRTASEVAFLKFTKWSYGIIGYDYVGGYLYLYGNTKLKKLRIFDIFESPEEINSCADGDTCYTDDSPYPMSKDMVQLCITSILTGEIKLTPKDVEVKQDT